MRKVFSVLGMALMLGIGAISSGVYGEFIAAKAAEEETEVVTVEAPRVSNATGAYTEEFDLTVTVPEGCTVYYTLDGSNPVNSSTRITYTSPIAVKDRTGDPNYVTAVDPALFDCAYATYDSENNVMTDTYSAPDDDKVDKATVVRAVACDSEGNYSTVTTNTYFVGSMADHIKGIKESCEAAGVPLSIMSISVNYEDLFDYETGIYVKGKVFEEAFAEVSKPKRRKNIVDETRKLPANYNQKGKEWEREAHIDYIESDGTNTSVKLQQDCGIRIQGNYSRSDLQKSFRLYARSEYGGKNFKYPFFGDDAKDSEGNTLAKFKKLVLRNGGNDAFITKYRDSYWQNLLKDMKNDTLASRVCVVYIDGEYWGVYVLQEDYGDDYMEDHHGVTKDNVVSYKGDAEKYPVIGYEMDDGTLPEGIDDYTYFMKDVNHFFYTHTKCVSQEDYDALAALFDPESVMEYFAVQAWVNNKWDWPGKNWYMWMTTEGAKEENVYTDGRWRHVYCDLDFGGWSGAGEAYNNTISNSGLLDVNKTNQVVRAFAYFMTNDNFRAQYKALLDSLDDEG
ncbi:MAG: CotH kinase family protein, partial [Lachnospiraceae bacterium]|nr:CotH kinase family protein [Lachnospiraceae bacterium]